MSEASSSAPWALPEADAPEEPSVLAAGHTGGSGADGAGVGQPGQQCPPAYAGWRHDFSHCTGEADGVLLAVADSGEGIAPDVLPCVFDRFYRGNSSRQGEQRGSGLGLAIAKALVQAHGGTIDVGSKLGIGTTFTILLPAR